MKKDRNQAGRHDWKGLFDPEDPVINHVCQYKTFSVGIFQWLPKSSGNGLKRSAVLYRVKGPVSNPEAVYSRAEALCDTFDDVGVFTGKKSETVK